MSARPPLQRDDVGVGEPALVFLHYFGGSGRAWNEVIAAPGSQGRRLALDLRGFGRSQGPPACASLAEHVEDVLAAIATAGVDRFIVVGHSMGGKIATALAIRRPRGLCGLVLAAPSPPSPEPIEDADREAYLQGYGRSATLETMLAKSAVRPISRAAHARFIGDGLATSREAWNWWLRTGSRDDIRDGLAAVDAPTLIMCGDQDGAIAPDLVRKSVGAIAGSRFVSLQGVGHFSPFEAPADLATLIADFHVEASRA